ncbi:PEP-CTERM sorting domain-containing protein [Microcystis aeruginosa CS-564/01]|uniref:PEP-CTERM sorting domain-containing protein n=1 Tax=Microcystis aeruginosa TaxID=1126 RepID=UPI00232B7AA2|nr:PEP-CTERM sorting domain-containing protein [Microcystis aeruginosa]MDB9426128.1 PEP-CTERM sorting domain-containing protein [Microcystis aeruginosa CS-564/01]
MKVTVAFFNKPLTVALATVATTTLAPVASAATFNFSFSNVTGPVSGTVQGTLTLPDGDGTKAATSVIVTSAPAALGYTLPFNVLANFTAVFGNSFTVSGGVITASSFAAQDNPFSSGLSLNFLPGTFGNTFSIAGSASVFIGVVDKNSTTLTYSPVPVPEPATVLGLLSVAGVGLLCKGRKLEG